MIIGNKSMNKNLEDIGEAMEKIRESFPAKNKRSEINAV